MNGAEDDAASSLITSVYHDVWDEFYGWEQEYCASEIRSLHLEDTSFHPAVGSEPGQPEPARLCTPHSFFSNISVNPDSLNWDYSNERITRQENPGSIDLIEYKIARLKAPKLNPTPCYESCLASATNVFVGDDSDMMPFVPYPSSSFDFARYRTHYDGFAWEEDHLDPDKETIVLESMRRLNAYHDIPIGRIHQILLPSAPVSKLGQRDLLQWTSFHRHHHEIPTAPSLPRRSDSWGRFEGIAKNFCPNLNCIEAFCPLHESIPPKGSQNYASQKVIRRTQAEPCGTDCHMYCTQSPTESDEVRGDDTIQNTLVTVLSVCPDLTTCQLAIACNRTCQETHAIRQKLDFPDPDVSSKRDANSELEIVCAIIEKLDHFTLDYEPGLPCAHSGPCDKAANCPCYLGKAYCEKSCRCSRQCLRRFRGCDCGVLRQTNFATCMTAACPCYVSERECDPEVCKSCNKGGKLRPLRVSRAELRVSSGGRCFNSQLQRGETKGVIVKRSKYGFGLFVSQAVHRGELIVEYTGEIIFESTVDSRSFFNEFRGRNYLYKLNNSVSVDATKLGNESRFINHDRAKVNCRARYMLVNGVQRIGIYALKHMRPGTELFLDYGDEFFQNR